MSSGNSLEQLRVFSFHEFDIRVIEKNGEPWFVLKEVCEALGDIAPRVVRQRLSDDVCSTYPIPDALGRTQQTTIVNEDGLYDVILDSRKAEAVRFRKWVTRDVLPSIRQTGSYRVNPRQEEASAKLHNAQARLQNAQANLLKEKTKQGQLIAKVMVDLKKAIPTEAMAALTQALAVVMTGEMLPAAQVDNRLQPEQAILWGAIKVSMLLHIDRPKDWSDKEQVEAWWDRLVQEMEPQMIYYLHGVLWAFPSLDDFTPWMRENLHERYQKLSPMK